MLDQGAPPQHSSKTGPAPLGFGARLMRRKPVEHLVAEGGQGEEGRSAAPSACGSSP
ncbi:hypothetical protein GCM10020295_69180 [Streptomyces cinereospinus]